MTDFAFHPLIEHVGDDRTEFRLLTKDGVSVARLGGLEFLKVAPAALEVLTFTAMDDIAHLLRASHLAQLRKILDDPEASRLHAAVEVLGEQAILRDLGSTNGTFVELERVEQKMLSNHMEFRIGSHVLMFIVTDVE